MITLLRILFVLCLCTPAYAQDKILFEPKHPADTLSGLHYTRLVQEALDRKPDTNFNYLRRLYPAMKFYQPETDMALRELFNHAKQAVKTQNTAEYLDFVMVHMAHPDVMWAAYILAEENKILGDPQLYLSIYRGLKQSLMISGDGKTPESAYESLTFGDENIILNALELKSYKTQQVKDGVLTHNMHTAYNVKEDQFYTIFINITKPLSIRNENKRIELHGFDFTDMKQGYKRNR